MSTFYTHVHLSVTISTIMHCLNWKCLVNVCWFVFSFRQGDLSLAPFTVCVSRSRRYPISYRLHPAFSSLWNHMKRCCCRSQRVRWMCHTHCLFEADKLVPWWWWWSMTYANYFRGFSQTSHAVLEEFSEVNDEAWVTRWQIVTAHNPVGHKGSQCFCPFILVT